MEDNNINGRSERSSIHYVRLGHLIFTQRCILDSMSLFAGLTLGRRSMVDHKIRSYASYLVFSAELEGLYLSESSRIRLAKTGKTAGFQRSKMFDISSRNRKPWKGVA